MYFDDNQINKIKKFLNKYNSNLKFKQFAEKVYDKNPEALPLEEIFALEEIIRYGNKEIYYKRLEDIKNYDELNPILYDNDKEIRQTLTNLFLGYLINLLVEHDKTLEFVKDYKKDNGQILNVHKKYVIQNLLTYIPEIIKYVSSYVDKYFSHTKFGVTSDEKEYAFALLEYNTNISFSEVLLFSKGHNHKK